LNHEVWKLYLNNIKALIVILAIAIAVFRLAGPVCLRFMAPEDFRTRRTAWFILTVAAFISPSFWIYALVAVPVSVWAGRRDSNPAALYLMLMFAVPALRAHIPKVIDLDQQRLLAIVVLIPALLRREPPPSRPTAPRSTAGIAGFLLFGFCTVQALLYIPYESWTSVLRREVTLLLVIMVPYLGFCRALRSYRSIPDAMATYLLSCAIMAPLALFETMRGWQLYALRAESWGMGVNPFGFLVRGSQLRAIGATNHSLTLGFVFAVGFGFSLYLMSTWKARWMAVWVYLLIWVGLFSAYARSGWISAVLAMFAYLWLLPRGASRVTKAATLLLMGGAVTSFTPFGQRILDSLPFIGTVDPGSVDYRQQLLEESMRLIPEHPWFGDLLVKEKMTSLYQGQGIIDLVNGYLQIALLYGLVTLGLVVLFMLISLGKTWRASKRARVHDEPVARVGSILVACMLAAFFFTWTAGFPDQLWMLAGMGIAYARFVARDEYRAS
jgi:hypothetical protein